MSDSRYLRALQWLLVLNAADAVFTSWWVCSGWATEANPVMACALDQGLGAFMGMKLGIGMAVVLFLRGHGHRRIARIGVAAALICYAAVVAFHLHAGVMQYADGTLLTLASR